MLKSIDAVASRRSACHRKFIRRRKKGKLSEGSIAPRSCDLDFRKHQLKEPFMKRIAGCLILLMVLASPQAISKTITFVCNGCNPAEKRVLAVESGAGDYFIFDVVNRNLVHWHVNQNTTAQLLSLSSDQQFLYNAVQSFYDTTGTLDISGYVDLSIERPNSITLYRLQAASTPSGGKATAFDVVTTPVIKQEALNQLTKANSIGGATNQVLLAFKTLASYTSSINVLGTGIRVPVNAQIAAIMPDGSYFLAEFDFNIQSFAYMKGSARDAVGNPIPEDAISAAGGPESIQKYIYPDTPVGHEAGSLGVQHLKEIGARIDVPVDFMRGAWTIACTRVEQVTQCHALPR